MTRGRACRWGNAPIRVGEEECSWPGPQPRELEIFAAALEQIPRGIDRRRWSFRLRHPIRYPTRDRRPAVSTGWKGSVSGEGQQRPPTGEGRPRPNPEAAEEPSTDYAEAELPLWKG